MPKKLFIALVEHAVVPGTIAALFYQTVEPSDRTIKKRFPDEKPGDLEVTHVLDLSHVVANDPLSLRAIGVFAEANMLADWLRDRTTG